jgi:hypothetical protein
LKELIPLGIVLRREAIGELLSKIAAEYNYNNPSESIPNLAKAYDDALDENHWVPLKSEAIKEIIAACSSCSPKSRSNSEALLN